MTSNETEINETSQDLIKIEVQHSNRYLTAKQMQAINVLLMGKSITDTALMIGVSRETISRWKNSNPNFIAEFNKHQQENMDATTIRLRSLVHKAVDVIEDSLNAGNLKAAVELLKAINLYSKMPEISKEIDPEMIMIRESENIAVSEAAKATFAGKPENLRKCPTNFIKTLAEDVYKIKKAVYDVPSVLDDLSEESGESGNMPKGVEENDEHE